MPNQNSHDSQQHLALSIARAIERETPSTAQAADHDAVVASVEQALAAESLGYEQAFAAARVGLAGLVAALHVVLFARPGLADLTSYPLSSVVSGLLFTAGAAGLLAALRRSWHRARLRRVIPAFDALLIGGTTFALTQAFEPAGRATPSGAVAGAATVCALLAISGSIRLSRSAGWLSGALALVTWAYVATLTHVRWPEGWFVALLLFGIAWLGTRATKIVRRVVTNEVSRLRLARLYEAAQEAIDTREHVLGMVSHDLRNPLNTIKMASELLLEVRPGDDMQRRHLGIIQRTGDRMNRMVQDLLDIARSDAGRLTVVRKDVAVSDLFAEVVELMQPSAEERSIKLETFRATDLARVNIDPDRIVQVFSNLVGNALKFTPTGGTVTIRAQPMGSKVRMSVADTGPGIPLDQMESLFGKFWQADPGDRRGIGLGLTIAKSLVEAHGERISAQNLPGGGAEFWFTVESAKQADA